MCSEEMKLWNELRTASFALVELGLYLDTHCEEPAAMALYQQYRAQRQNAMEALNLQYGPVTPYDQPGEMDLDLRAMALGRGGMSHVDL